MSLRKGGRLVQVGLTSKEEQGIVGIPLDELIEAELTIIGSVGNPHIHLPASARPSSAKTASTLRGSSPSGSRSSRLRACSSG